ncbi:MAG: DoxX family protein [Opitutaceae bacterium]
MSPSSSTSTLARPCAAFARAASWLQSPVLLFVRVYWGWQFFLTGKGKLSDLSRPEAFFAQLHLPAPHLTAIVVSVTECVGGLLLAIGFGTRILALIFTVEMLVAFQTADADSFRAIVSDPDKFTGATPFLFLYAAVILLAFGPGRLAVDALLGRGRAS